MVGEEYEKDYNYCRSIDCDDAAVNSLRSVYKCGHAVVAGLPEQLKKQFR
jgi:hypothetical protein